ncbi:MAG: FapA family protein [Spirochaeta sp.]|nr:FapA family protein [Spirochaeta sp.]
MSGESSSDALIQVEVASDSLSANAEFIPARGEGRPLSMEYVEHRLSEAGVTNGVLWDVIQDAIAACTDEKRRIADLTIARGSAPEPDLPERIILMDRFAAVARESLPAATSDVQEQPEMDSASRSRVDYKAISPYVIVRRGEELGRVEQEMIGTDGLGVNNKQLQRPVAAVLKLEPGKNIEVRDNEVYALKSGQFQVRGKVFSIEETLEISGEVGYRTGNINFPGNLVLAGEVKDGFRIWVGGSIYAKATVDAHEIFARGEILAAEGIIGRGNATVRAVKKITAKFIENCLVESKSSIYIKNSVVNSKIAALDRVVMGDTGKIVGSEIRAVEGVTAHQVGNSAEIPTTIVCGVDFIVERMLSQMQEQHQQLMTRVQALRVQFSDDPRQKLAAQIRAFETRARELSNKMAGMIDRLDRNESAELRVLGTIYPGVRITICRAQLAITEKKPAVVYSLDRVSGRIVESKIER